MFTLHYVQAMLRQILIFFSPKKTKSNSPSFIPQSGFRTDANTRHEDTKQILVPKPLPLDDGRVGGFFK